MEAGFDIAGQDAKGIQAGTWRALAASVTGASHRRKNLGCDDAAAVRTNGRWLAAAVCDGAGSSSHGGEGAALTARLVCAELMSTCPGRNRGVSVRSLIVSSLETVRMELDRVAVENQLPLAAFATTVVGILVHGRFGVVFHIGDGAALVVSDKNSVRTASTGSEQEYANETYFLTDAGWREHVRFAAATRVDGLMLMTDGVTPFALAPQGPRMSFFEPVLRYVEAHPPEKAVLGVQRMLASESSQSQVADDKTLLWAGIERQVSAASTDGIHHSD